MKRCTSCQGTMKELSAKTPEGVSYAYYKCHSCGEEIVDMSQLNAVAQKYREIKKFNAKISQWGMSLGIRIPKELVKQYKLRSDKEVTIIPEKEGMRIIPV